VSLGNGFLSESFPRCPLFSLDDFQPDFDQSMMVHGCFQKTYFLLYILSRSP